MVQTRIQFLAQLRRLTSAAQSINKVVAFLLKQSVVPHPGSRKRPASESDAPKATHGESDLWDCIMEELAKASINARMNIFYMLDSLLDQSLALGVETYRAFITADLERIVTLTVPTDVRDGVLNRMSTMQVRNSLKTDSGTLLTRITRSSAVGRRGGCYQRLSWMPYWTSSGRKPFPLRAADPHPNHIRSPSPSRTFCAASRTIARGTSGCESGSGSCRFRHYTTSLLTLALAYRRCYRQSRVHPVSRYTSPSWSVLLRMLRRTVRQRRRMQAAHQASQL